MNEAPVQQRVRLEAPHLNCHLTRNNVGAAKDLSGRLIRYGLWNESKKMNEEIKSSDLMGATSIVITPEMVGRTVAVLTAIETKAEGWVYNENHKRSAAQMKFLQFVANIGGIAGFVNGTNQLKKILDDWINRQ